MREPDFILPISGRQGLSAEWSFFPAQVRTAMNTPYSERLERIEWPPLAFIVARRENRDAASVSVVRWRGDIIHPVLPSVTFCGSWISVCLGSMAAGRVLSMAAGRVLYGSLDPIDAFWMTNFRGVARFYATEFRRRIHEMDWIAPIDATARMDTLYHSLTA